MQYVPVDVTVETQQFLQASESIDMQSKLDAAVNAGVDSGITSTSLACGGDGHSFVLRIGRDPGEPPGSLNSVDMVAYDAADAAALPLARAEAIARLVPGSTIRDELVAGGSKGHKYMGIIVTGAVT